MAVEAVEAVEAVVTRSVVAVVGPVTDVGIEARSVVPVGLGCVVAELGPVAAVCADTAGVPAP